MKIGFFGKLGDLIGREVALEPPGPDCTVGELRALLADRFPAAQADLLGPRLRACVDDRIVADDFRIHSASKVEFFPPLSGG